MQDISDRIKQIAKEAEPELISIRRELHQYPELGINLPKTHEIISRELKKIPNLKVREHMAGGYGIIAELQGKKAQGKNILLRADIDALPLEEQVDCDYKSTHPGKMHACGHAMMQEQHVVEIISKSYRFVDMVFGTHNVYKLADNLDYMLFLHHASTQSYFHLRILLLEMFHKS